MQLSGSSPRPADAAADGRHPVEQLEQLGDVVAVAAGERPGERDAAAVYEEVVLAARAGRDRRGWDPFSSPFFRLQVTRVGDRPRPLELLGGVQLGEQQLVQPLPDAGLLPGPQPPPRGHPAAEPELLRQMLPADPGVQHEQDPLQRQPVIERLATRIAEAPLPARQQRLDPLPQPVRHIPRLRPHRHPSRA